MTATFNFIVYGDTYEELVENANAMIDKFVSNENEEEDDLDERDAKKIDYELSITPNSEGYESDKDYVASVVARIKNAKTNR